MKIALLGYGVVGRGVHDIVMGGATPALQGLTVSRILVREGRHGDLPGATSDYADIVNDPDIGCVVEALGGLHPAYEYIMAALQAKKHVVTSNKAVLAQYYEEFHRAARDNGVQLRYEASVAGGIPWIASLRKAARVDEIRRFSGIMNGTTNYILYHMFQQGADFGAVLADAQALGYAEADPTADIDGLDVQNKCIISAAVAFGHAPTHDQVPVFGIRNIQGGDVSYFKEQGLVCKLIAAGVKQGDRFFACVEPVLFPEGALEAAVPLNFNLATLEGDSVGALKFYGQGAGGLPTGNAVVQDLLDLAQPVDSPAQPPALTCDPALMEAAYFVRIDSAAYERARALLGDYAESALRINGVSMFKTKPMQVGAFARAREQLLELDGSMFAARYA